MSWLDDARARCDAATPGPWRADLSQLDDVVVWAGDEEDPDLVFNVGDKITVVGEAHPRDSANGTFVAHARTDLPRALALLDKAELALKMVPVVHAVDCEHQLECDRWRDDPELCEIVKAPGPSRVACTCHVAVLCAVLASLAE